MKHYMRKRNTGRLDRDPPPPFYFNQGYRMVKVPAGHPLVTACGNLWCLEHRVIYWQHHGDQEIFRCHVCDAELTWDEMVIDHLNEVRDDNRIENLAPACRTCNVHRSLARTVPFHCQSYLEYLGERRTVAEWADRLGIAVASMQRRLRTLPMADALTRPRHKRN